MNKLLCIVVFLALLAGNAFGQGGLKPPDQCGLGVPDPTFPGTPPFEGYYLAGYPGSIEDNIQFRLQHGKKPEDPPELTRLTQTWGVPPEAKDVKADGQAELAAIGGNPQSQQPVNGTFVGGYWWVRLRGKAPGWVKLEVLKGGSIVQAGYYRFYRVHIIEDDVGDSVGYYKGFDPRYGTKNTSQFSDLGGPYKPGAQLNDPPAEDILGWDDRFLEKPEPWTGVSLARVLGPLPESMLKPYGGAGNSLMANRRDHQTVRVFIEGPRENSLPRVPIYLLCTDHGQGSLGAGGSYDLKATFLPPDPFPATAPGDWMIIDGAPANPPAIRKNLIDLQTPQSPNGNAKWMLRWPVTGTSASSYYGDIEIEAKIPNPDQCWKLYGASGWKVKAQ